MKHVDLSYIIKLAAGNSQFVSDVINSFIEITPSYVQEMRHWCEEKNWPGLQAAAHRFKSAGRYLGLHELVRIIETIEESAKKQADLQNLPELMTAMHALYEVSVNELKSNIGNFHLQRG